MERINKHDAQRISRRSLIMGGVQIAVATGLAGRLYYLQIEENRQYSKLSDRNKYDFRIIPPSRGRINDAAGRLLAGNAETYELSIIPQYNDDLAQLMQQLSSLIDLQDDEIARFIADAAEQPSFLPLPLRADLTQREVARIAVRIPELPGVSFERAEKRIYPQGVLGGNLTGYVSRATAAEVKEGIVNRELAHLSTGKSGVEKQHEFTLRGAPGRRRILVNAFGRPISSSTVEAPISGRNLVLNIDMDDQRVANEALQQGQHKPLELASPRVQQALIQDDELRKILADDQSPAFENAKGQVVPAETGSVVALDIKTGAVKILLSSPTFDPNLFVGGLSSRDWGILSQNPRRPLIDRCIAGQYPPGSTFKMVVALAALEAGIITENTKFHCSGHRRVGDTDFHCWRPKGHGSVNIIDAIEQSCDVYFYEIGLKTGIKRIGDMARRLGLGGATGINIPREKSGLIPTKAWKKKKTGESWLLGETVNASIGQGYVLATPLQLAVMTARIANGKAAVNPMLAAGDNRADAFADLKISQAGLEIVRRGMRAVMSGKKGTARFHDLPIKGVGMAGKTGTVQVRAISKAEREEGIIDNADRVWKFRDHALFTAFAPYDDPRYAVAVVVEHGGSGSGVAAPIARRVMTHLISKSGV